MPAGHAPDAVTALDHADPSSVPGVALAHTASEEQDAGRLSGEDAEGALRASLFRVLGAAGGEGPSPRPE
ncbi:hypothetical protein GCM10027168_49970 [Streptomyces capparidis]